MTPETNEPSASAPRLKQLWWALLVALPLLFMALALLGAWGAASICAVMFVTVVLLPIGTKQQTVGAGYESLNEMREAFGLFKGADTIVLPKTGTLTGGRHSVVDVQSFVSDLTADQVLELACAVERNSDHPIARAIVSAAESKGLGGLSAARDLRAIPGVGVFAMLDGRAITIGGPSLLTARNLTLTVDQLLLVNSENSRGRTVGYVIRNNELLGCISTADAVTESAASKVASAQRLGKEVLLLSSDAQGVAEWLAAELGLDAAYGEVLPHQRAEFFARLQADGKKVAVVGSEFAPDSDSLIVLAASLDELDSLIVRGLQLRAKVWQNRVAAAILGLAGIPLVSMAFSKADPIATLVYGSVLISLSTAFAVLQVRSMKR